MTRCPQVCPAKQGFSLWPIALNEIKGSGHTHGCMHACVRLFPYSCLSTCDCSGTPASAACACVCLPLLSGYGEMSNSSPPGLHRGCRGGQMVPPRCGVPNLGMCVCVRARPPSVCVHVYLHACPCVTVFLLSFICLSVCVCVSTSAAISL